MTVMNLGEGPVTLVAIITKYGFPIRLWVLLYQALLKCLWIK